MITYPEHPGFKTGGTSKEAAVSMVASCDILRVLCLNEIQKRDMTSDEVAKALGYSVLSIRPRFTELKALGCVEATGTKRKNDSGRNASVVRFIKPL